MTLFGWYPSSPATNKHRYFKYYLPVSDPPTNRKNGNGQRTSDAQKSAHPARLILVLSRSGVEQQKTPATTTSPALQADDARHYAPRSSHKRPQEAGLFPTTDRETQ